ncbi:MAG: WYL domain-containing protein [Planctomycetota bacterium]|nr:WYL domain-containing protein [Planctomycetota bacterium]
MARNEQLIRQHKILQILERVRYGKTLDEIRDDLVDELGLKSLHTRSVRRDLEALQMAGIDVDVHDSGRGRVWKIGPRAKSTYKITASATELIALSLGRDLLYPLAGTPFWIGIESFWNKIQEELPDTVTDHYEKYRQILHVLGTPAKSYEKHDGMIKTFNRAILEHRVAEAAYRPLGKPVTTRKLEPLAIVFYQSSLYIIARIQQAQESDRLEESTSNGIRHWKLDRFEKVTALDEWFKPPKGFDLGSHISQSVGIFSGRNTKNFKIWISEYAAQWVIEDPWHPSQKVNQLKDGSIELKIQASHELEIIPRVLSLGAEAEILAPATARKKAAEMIASMMEKYQ